MRTSVDTDRLRLLEAFKRVFLVKESGWESRNNLSARPIITPTIPLKFILYSVAEVVFDDCVASESKNKEIFYCLSLCRVEETNRPSTIASDLVNHLLLVFTTLILVINRV